MNGGSAASLPLGLVVVVGAVCLALSAFFSGSETGVMSVSRARLRRLLQEGQGRVSSLEKLLVRIEDPILTCLIGTNLFNVLLSAMVTMAVTERYGPGAEWLAILLVATLVILLGEILPKVLYREFPERLTLLSVGPLGVANRLLGPVRWLLGLYSALWRRILARHREASGLDRLSLAALLLTNSVPSRHEEHFALVMDRFLQLAHLDLGPIMRPLEHLVSVHPGTSAGQCMAVAARSGFSRLPIIADQGDGLFGYVLVRDLLFLPREDHDRPVPRRLWRAFLLVDVRMSPYELFEELRSQGRQLAVVADAGGNPLGMITLEDLIESVMGSISDEFDAVIQAKEEA